MFTLVQVDKNNIGHIITTISLDRGADDISKLTNGLTATAGRGIRRGFAGK